jgi:hypothetical protein
LAGGASATVSLYPSLADFTQDGDGERYVLPGEYTIHGAFGVGGEHAGAGGMAYAEHRVSLKTDDSLAAAALSAATANEDWPGAPEGLGAVAPGKSAFWPVKPGLRAPRSCSPLEFGAKGDNETDDTVAVQRAVDSCSTVVFSSGYKFLVGSIMLNHSNLHLHFEKNASAILKQLDPNGGFTWCSGCVLENITVTGADRHTSVIDGQGWLWWKLHGVAHKPKLMTLHNVRRAHISNLLFRNSAAIIMI